MNITYINYFSDKEKSFKVGNFLYKFFEFLKETKDIWSAILKRDFERRQLSRMSDYMLNDIGLTRADADKEVNKWFWQI